ncbi:MAG: dihydrolipoyl dehydrogenase [Gammaproteobacteria bacterium]
MNVDLVVLGAGPGGYTAAFRAADLGLSVALVERDATLGGVCLNVGCIPSKALLHAAKVIADARDMAAHGVTFGAPAIDLPRLRGWKEKVIGQLTGGLQGLARQRKVQVVRGEGRFTSPTTLAVGGGEAPTTVTFRQAIIAAGSEPVKLPGIPYDDPRVIDSTGALALVDIPSRLLVIGGGIIGLEMATVYAELGSAVTVVELTDGLMPGADRDLVRPLEKRLKGRLAGIHVGTKVTGVTVGKEGLEAAFEGKGAPARATFDRVLVAVGRRANGAALGLDAAGVEVDARGVIRTDRQMRTNVPHIFAIGDVTQGPMLAHKASHEGKVAAEVAAGHKAGFDARVIPSVAYTDPEVAWAGLTETEAKAQGIAYEKAVFPWAASGRALSLGRSEGQTKLLFDTDGRVIGAGIVGPSAGDLIAEAALAIEMSCDAEDIGLTIHPHPTLSETVAMAAEMFAGTITDLYVPRKSKS